VHLGSGPLVLVELAKISVEEPKALVVIDRAEESSSPAALCASSGSLYAYSGRLRRTRGARCGVVATVRSEVLEQCPERAGTADQDVQELVLGNSVGAHRYAGEDDLRELPAKDDAAMYQAKRERRVWGCSPTRKPVAWRSYLPMLPS
jgi:hypothetical protein